MDKVEDKTDVKRNGLDFKEEPNPKFRGLGDPRISESDLALWDQSPPVAEFPSESEQAAADERDRKKADAEAHCKKFSRCMSISAIIVTLICVWSLTAIPQLCYFHVAGFCQYGSDGAQEEVETFVQLQNCSHISYTGICSNNFGVSCSNPYVNVPVNSSIETNIQTLFLVIDNPSLFDSSSSCASEKDLIKEFVCVYSYQPCDADDKAVVPARNVCAYLRDNVCSNEWSILLSGEFHSLLPSCGSLPNVTSTPSCLDDGMSNGNVSPTTTAAPTPTDVSSPTDNDGSCVQYEGTICSEYFNSCPINNSDAQQEQENTLDSLFVFINLAPDPGCKESQSLLKEFFCATTFHPCDLNNTVHLPNRSHCEYIRDELCPVGWTYIPADVEPNCSTLPAVSHEPYCIDSMPTQQPSSTSSSTSIASSTPTPLVSSNGNESSSLQLNGSLSLACNEKEGFHLFITDDVNSTLNNTCQALCSKWYSSDSRAVSIVDDVVVLTSTIIGILGSIAVVVFSVIRRERMFVFPSVFLIYGVLHVLELGIIVVVQYTSRSYLSCSSDNLVVTSRDSPTPFCQISGMILLHSLIGLTYWWFAHICAIFWKIMFPFQAKLYDDRTKYIHLVAGIVGIILPVIPPCLPYIWDGYGLNRFPPLLCLPKNTDVMYYSVLLPLSLVITAGITLLIFVLHVIHEKSRLFHYRVSKTHKFGLSTAEKKLLIVFVYYLFLGYIDVIGFIVSIALLGAVGQLVEENFACEAFRVDPDYVCPRKFEEVGITSVFATITYVLLGMYPLINLVFAVNKSEVQTKLVTWFPSLFTESFRTSTLSASVINTPDTPFAMRRRLTYNFSTTDHIKPSNEMATIGKSGFYMKKKESTVSFKDPHVSV